MSKQKISAKQVLNDISAGMSNSELMEKYGVSSEGLESIFKKLTDAGLLNEASLEQRTLSSRPDAIIPSGHASIPKTAPAVQPEQKSTDSLMSIAGDIKNGVHEGEIMRRYELSPGKLREIKEKLVQEGHLESNRIEQEEVKRTKKCPFCSREIPQSAGKCSHCGEWVDTAPNVVARHRPVPMTESPEAPFAEDDFEGEKECAWEERANYGTTKAFIKTATESLMRPSNFFSNLPLDGNYLDPILFAVMSGVMGIVLAYMWTSLFSGGLLGLVGLLFSMAIVFLALLISLPLILLFLERSLAREPFSGQRSQRGIQNNISCCLILVGNHFVQCAANTVPWQYCEFVGSCANGYRPQRDTQDHNRKSCGSGVDLCGCNAGNPRHLFREHLYSDIWRDEGC